MASNNVINRHILNNIGKYGWKINQKAMQPLKSFLAEIIQTRKDLNESLPNIDDEITYIMNDLMDNIKKHAPSGTITILEDLMLKAIESYRTGDSNPDESQAIDDAVNNIPGPEYLKVISASDMPRFDYHGSRRLFVRDQISRSLYGAANDKALLYQHRLNLISQRVRRTHSISSGVSSYLISTLDSLLGTTESRCVIGILVELVEDEWYFEDEHAVVKLDLSEVEVLSGTHGEGSVVLAEGHMIDDNVFKVLSLALPPIEPRETTINTYPTLGLCGLTNEIADLDKHTKICEQIRLQRESDMIVVLSDVFLDDTATLNKLKTIFQGYSECPPVMFVFTGSFFPSIAPFEYQTYELLFSDLADMISKFPVYKDTHFLFIPGPNDPVVAPVLPTSPFIPALVHKLKQKLKHVYFASNPCRVSYFGLELVFFRYDLVKKMRNHCILSSTNIDGQSEEYTRTVAETVLSEAHLCPLSLDKQPVYWQLDHTLMLYPSPDLLIMADSVDTYTWEFGSTTVCNPGSFSKSGSFTVYYPASKTTEHSSIG